MSGIRCPMCDNDIYDCECGDRYGETAPSSCTVDSVVGFPIPTSYEEYLMLTDEQKFRLYEIAKKPNGKQEGQA